VQKSELFQAKHGRRSRSSRFGVDAGFHICNYLLRHRLDVQNWHRRTRVHVDLRVNHSEPSDKTAARTRQKEIAVNAAKKKCSPDALASEEMLFD
jgi:hypothetical protein